MNTEPEPTFEEAIDGLERIVGELERGDVDLAASLASYQKGVALLTGVEDDGTPIMSPFDATATADTPARRARPASAVEEEVDPPF